MDRVQKQFCLYDPECLAKADVYAHICPCVQVVHTLHAYLSRN